MCMFDCMNDCLYDDVCCVWDAVENIPQELCILDGENEIHNEKCDSLITEKDEERSTDIMKISKFKIEYEELKGRPSIEFQIKNKKVRCLLDTGARVNVIKVDLLKNMKDVKIKETKRRIHCANDSELVNYGIVQLKIKIERIQKTVDFLW